MIPIPPHLPDAGQARRSESPARSVPPVIDASVVIDHGVTLDLSPPVGRSATEGRARDSLNASVSDINQTRAGRLAELASGDAATELSQLPPGLAQRVGKLLAQLAVPQLLESGPIQWPAADGSATPQYSALADEPGKGLLQLRQQLADSPMFDLHRLVDRLMPAASSAPSFAAAALHPEQHVADADPDSAESGPQRPLAAVNVEPPQAPRLDQSQVRDGLRLLMHGQLLWNGELAPGLFARVEREDGWQADPHEPGQMIKGTALNVELRLPNLGLVRVRGLQIKDSIEVAIEVDDSLREVLGTQLDELQSGLKQAGLTQVRPRIVTHD